MLHRASDFRSFGGYPIKHNEVDGTCSMYGGKKYVYMVLMGKAGKEKTTCKT
jgi:hypothetical protein